MANTLYIGNVNNLSKKAKNLYIGDSNNIARKAKKIYIGDENNKARLCYSSGLDKIVYCTSKGYTYYCHDRGTVLQGTYDISPYMPTSSEIVRVSSIAYDGNSRLVCTHPNSSGSSAYNSAFYSDDGGINWYQSNLYSTNANSNYISQHLTYCNGYFIVPNYYGFIQYSTDGINWKDQLVLSDNKFKKVVYGNGKYIIIHYNGGAYYNTDLETGSWKATGSSYGICEIAYGNGIFVGYMSGNGFYIYDETKNIWVLKSTEIVSTNENITGMAYANGRFVFTTRSYVAYSDDGINWTKYSSGSAFLGYNYVTSLNSNGELFFAGISNGRIAYSSDGINWTIIDAYGITNGTITGICGT